LLGAELTAKVLHADAVPAGPRRPGCRERVGRERPALAVADLLALVGLGELQDLAVQLRKGLDGGAALRGGGSGVARQRGAEQEQADGEGGKALHRGVLTRRRHSAAPCPCFPSEPRARAKSSENRCNRACACIYSPSETAAENPEGVLLAPFGS